MIIGIDHIIYNSDGKKNNFLSKKIYQKIFKIRKKNHPEKNKFLLYNNKDHDLTFFKPKNKLPSIEITNYKKFGNKVDVIVHRKNNIIINTNSVKKEKKFLEGILKIKIRKNNFPFKSIFDDKKYNFQLKKKFFNKYYLDNVGCVAICFVAVNLKQISKELLKHKIECSKIFNFVINRIKLKILLIRSEGNVIYEILEFTK